MGTFKKGDIVYCKNTAEQGNLTRGMQYEVEEVINVENHQYLRIVDDRGISERYYSWRFINETQRVKQILELYREE
jgi:hypothetical protein